MSERRYDIDWIRVIAIALLMVYHVAIVFQPWGLMVGFMTNSEPWESLWLPMTMLNVWRIPILFFIAGIGVFFSFRNRNLKQLLKERALRIGIPYLFGIVAIVPIYLIILQTYYDWKIEFVPQESHLWFLGNILCYVIITILPMHFLRSGANSLIAAKLRQLFSSFFIFPFVIFCFVMETVIVNPPLYEMYAKTSHGFFLGWLAFVFGYLFAFAGDDFWNKLVKLRWLFLGFAVLFFTFRTGDYLSFPKKINLPIETCLWIFAIFAFARKYLSFPHKFLNYFSKAAYPLYILHMVFLGLSCSFLLPLVINVQLKLCMVLIGTIGGSLICYELVIKRNKYVGRVFGINSL